MTPKKRASGEDGKEFHLGHLSIGEAERYEAHLPYQGGITSGDLNKAFDEVTDALNGSLGQDKRLHGVFLDLLKSRGVERHQAVRAIARVERTLFGSMSGAGLTVQPAPTVGLPPLKGMWPDRTRQGRYSVDAIAEVRVDSKAVRVGVELVAGQVRPAVLLHTATVTAAAYHGHGLLDSLTIIMLGEDLSRLRGRLGAPYSQVRDELKFVNLPIALQLLSIEGAGETL